MEDFTNTFGRCLWVFYTLYTENRISKAEQGRLKDMLISRKSQSFNHCLKRFEKERDITEFKKSLEDLLLREDSSDEVEKVPDLMVTSARLSKEVLKVQRPQPIATTTLITTSATEAEIPVKVKEEAKGGLEAESPTWRRKSKKNGTMRI